MSCQMLQLLHIASFTGLWSSNFFVMELWMRRQLSVAEEVMCRQKPLPLYEVYMEWWFLTACRYTYKLSWRNMKTCGFIKKLTCDPLDIHWIQALRFFWWYRFAPWETHWLPIKLNSKPNTAGAKTTLWKNHRRWREKQASHREALSHCHENSRNLLKLNLWSDWLYNPVQTLKPQTKANIRGQTKNEMFTFQKKRIWI